jgi:hypothetical protein
MLDRRFLGSAFVTVVVLGLYGAVVLGLAPKPDADLAETLKALVTLAAGYWIGSSSGSASKDANPPEITK